MTNYDIRYKIIRNFIKRDDIMDSLIFSLNATIPVFLIMVAGYVLHRRGMLTEGFVNSADKFNFNVALPVMLFTDLISTNIREEFDIKFALFCAAITTVMFFCIWIGAKIFVKDKSMTGAFVQASYRSSVAVLGIAFITNIYGNAGMMPMIIIGSVPLYNIFAVVVLSFESPKSKNSSLKAHIKTSLVNIIKNPIIISIFLGVLCAFINLKLPQIINKTLTSIGSLASPLTLIAIGAGFEGAKAIKKIKPTLAASIIKLVVLPAVFIPIAIRLGWTDRALVALIIMLGSPTTPSCYIMTKNMHGDHVLTSSIVVTTTLLSSITLTFWIFICRFLGYIA